MGGKIPHALKEQLERCWRAGVAAVEPGAAVRRALDDDPPPDRPVHVLAFGKAAPAMAAGVEEWLARYGRSPAGGIVVAPSAAPAVPTRLRSVVGDHPSPGENSRRAADALGAAVAAVGPEDLVWVLLSGGASSLVAAPVHGLSAGDLGSLWSLLLASGLDIHAMNAVRRRFTRWGGGRLALALAGRPIDVLAVSDVPGDDPATIGSGPCTADPLSAADVERALRDAGLWDAVPAAVREMLRGGSRPGATVGPGHLALASVRARIIARNADAVRAAARCAEALGWTVRSATGALTGPAADAGVRIASALMDGATDDATQPLCLVEGGETTVALGVGDAAAAGGRCQELALAAAAILSERRGGSRAALLAGGTDGRDGPTDAAGAVVDGQTWRRVIGAGLDPARSLARHDSYRALDAAGALLRTGPTGTNVMDLVIASVVQG